MDSRPRSLCGSGYGQENTFHRTHRGGALGYFISAARFTCGAAIPRSSEGAWGGLLETKTRPGKTPEPSRYGIVVCPLDSWVYPSLGALGGLGYLSTAFLGIRPWTRMECARLLEEMDEEMDTDTDTNTNTNKDDRMGLSERWPR